MTDIHPAGTTAVLVGVIACGCGCFREPGCAVLTLWCLAGHGLLQAANAFLLLRCVCCMYFACNARFLTLLMYVLGLSCLCFSYLCYDVLFLRITLAFAGLFFVLWAVLILDIALDTVIWCVGRRVCVRCTALYSVCMV